MDASYQPNADVLAGVLLAERLVFGFLVAAHGTQKLLGWFRGAGLDNAGGFFEQLGFRPGRAFAAAAGLAELTAGIALAGFGHYSLDAALGIADWSSWLRWTVLGGGALAGFTNVLARRLPAPTPAPIRR